MQYKIERNTVTKGRKQKVNERYTMAKGRKQTGTTNTEWLYHRRRI